MFNIPPKYEDLRKRDFYHPVQNPDIIIFTAIMIMIAGLLFRKCRYGFGNIDESFYITIPYRLCQGDKMFLDEWHLSLMSGYLLIPLMKIYLMLNNGTTDGIILTFRYFAVSAQLISTIVLYFPLRKYSKTGALIGCICWMIYIPFNINALSYNSMGIIFLTTGLVLLATADKKPLFFLAGILYANSVLCCPYLAILWALSFIAVLISHFVLRKNDILWTRFLWSTWGILLSACLFLFTVFSQITFVELMTVLPYILNDPEHSTSIVDKCISYYNHILYAIPGMQYIWASYFLVCIIAALSKKKKIKYVCLVLVFALSIVHLHGVIDCYQYPNFIMFPVNITAVSCFVIFRTKRASRLFHWVWIPGMIYTFCLQLSSNQDMYAISSAATVPMIASFPIILATVSDEWEKSNSKTLKIVVITMLSLLVLLQSGAELYFRMNTVFWENSMNNQTVLLTEGPEAGLLVTDEKELLYNSYRADLDIPNGKVLFFTNNTWLYLCGEWRNASYSAWLSGPDRNSLSKLEAYYQINPNKKPDYIFLDHSYAKFLKVFTDNWGYRIICTSQNGNILLGTPG